MSKRRSRVVAVQAIVVSLLAVVVVVTLLKPEDSGLLSGLTTPGGQEPSTLPVPGAYLPRTGEHAGGGNGPQTAPTPGSGPVAGGVAPSTGSTITLPAAPAAAAPAASGGGESGTDDGEGSPTDDQYADTLSRITGRLN